MPPDLPADEAPRSPAPDATGEEPWYVYDRHATLLAVTDTLTEAEAGAIEHWGVVKVADRQQVDAHDYWYLLLAAPPESGFATRDFQARIMRRDRARQIGRDDGTAPQYPR